MKVLPPLGSKNPNLKEEQAPAAGMTAIEAVGKFVEAVGAANGVTDGAAEMVVLPDLQHAGPAGTSRATIVYDWRSGWRH